MTENVLTDYYAFVKVANWEAAEEKLMQLIEDGDKGFWILCELSGVYYQLKDYKKALIYAKKAYLKNPNSPLVLWHYSIALMKNEKESRAIKMLHKILNYNEEEIAFKITKEGKRWAQSLRNDVGFLIAEAYYILSENNKALEYVQEHLKSRRKGLPSTYTKAQVLKLLKKIEYSISAHNS
ncbi:MAG: hypothetical protein ABIV51_00620 [Saprospiraceae bacterium]